MLALKKSASTVNRYIEVQSQNTDNTPERYEREKRNSLMTVHTILINKIFLQAHIMCSHTKKNNKVKLRTIPNMMRVHLIAELQLTINTFLKNWPLVCY